MGLQTNKVAGCTTLCFLEPTIYQYGIHVHFYNHPDSINTKKAKNPKWVLDDYIKSKKKTWEYVHTKQHPDFMKTCVRGIFQTSELDGSLTSLLSFRTTV